MITETNISHLKTNRVSIFARKCDDNGNLASGVKSFFYEGADLTADELARFDQLVEDIENRKKGITPLTNTTPVATAPSTPVTEPLASEGQAATNAEPETETPTADETEQASDNTETENETEPAAETAEEASEPAASETEPAAPSAEPVSDGSDNPETPEAEPEATPADETNPTTEEGAAQ